MSNQPQQQTLEEFIAQCNNEIILGSNNSQQRSLGVLNKVIQNLQQALIQIQKKDEEIVKFNNFCKENKIDYPPKPKSPPKDNKIAPVEK